MIVVVALVVLMLGLLAFGACAAMLIAVVRLLVPVALISGILLGVVLMSVASGSGDSDTGGAGLLIAGAAAFGLYRQTRRGGTGVALARPQVTVPSVRNRFSRPDRAIVAPVDLQRATPPASDRLFETDRARLAACDAPPAWYRRTGNWRDERDAQRLRCAWDSLERHAAGVRISVARRACDRFLAGYGTMTATIEVATLAAHIRSDVPALIKHFLDTAPLANHGERAEMIEAMIDAAERLAARAERHSAEAAAQHRRAFAAVQRQAHRETAEDDPFRPL